MTWKSLIPPKRDSKGVDYECTDCSLNLHAYTDRNDKRDQYSITTASGMLLGVGNVGKYLKVQNDSKMYLSRDAGITWSEITDQAYMYEISESGAVFILANDLDPSASIRFFIIIYILDIPLIKVWIYETWLLIIKLPVVACLPPTY